MRVEPVTHGFRIKKQKKSINCQIDDRIDRFFAIHFNFFSIELKMLAFTIYHIDSRVFVIALISLSQRVGQYNRLIYN